MSTKTSPPSTSSTSNGAVKIKKEIGNDEIKDFAETAMNELLGWYGYDSVDRIDLSAKSNRLVTSSAINSSDNQSHSDINGNRRNFHRGDDSTSTDHESSRENSKSPNVVGKSFSEKDDSFCGWCRRDLLPNTPEFLATPDGPRYCSESCFAQSRRASFKRAKTCDWCRHVRHAVSYVDFQDGASQLQFCSDKCLNQYKMQIFCKETQAHLDMNPHLKEKGSLTAAGGLITPELWLKNCRSRSASPVSDDSRSPTPKTPAVTISATQASPVSLAATPHKPMISVAPASKLMMSKTPTPSFTNTRPSPKHSRKRRLPRYNPNPGNTGGPSGLNNHTNNSNILANCLANNSTPPIPKPCTFTNIQDLRLNVPPISPVESTQSPRPSHPSQNFFPSMPNLFPLRAGAPFMAPHPRILGYHPHNIPHLPPPPPNVDFNAFAAIFGGAPPPPITVMVPYPVIIPLPIPIPIPLPMSSFLKAANIGTPATGEKSATETAKTTHERENSVSVSPSQQPTTSLTPPSDEPLDFTKSKNPEKPTVSTPNNETKTDSVIEESMQITEILPEENPEDSSNDRRLPKFKITRLQSKRLISAREAENSRPLRKRKRIIDCDYLKCEEDAAKQKK